MQGMPRPRPPHLHRETTRHGVTVWYVRTGKGPRLRLRAPYGSAEFEAEYKAALRGEKVAGVGGPAAGTVLWLLGRYRDSQAWAKLSPATRKQRENIFRQVTDKIGAKPLTVITGKSMRNSLDHRAATPFQAKNFLDAMRGLFVWAVTAKLASADPTEGIRAAKPKTDGFRVWTEEEITRFEAHWPIGTRERLAFDILLHTGLRRGDAAALGRQHLKNGLITLRTAKTGEVVTLPVRPELERSIAATAGGDLTFIVGVSGRAMVKEAFGNWFRETCNAAKVPGSAHGLRKAAATRLADAGCSEAQLEAVFGWRGGGMASLYTKAANRRKLAIEAMSKLAAPAPYSRTLQSGAGGNAKKGN